MSSMQSSDILPELVSIGSCMDIVTWLVLNLESCGNNSQEFSHQQLLEAGFESCWKPALDSSADSVSSCWMQSNFREQLIPGFVGVSWLPWLLWLQRLEFVWTTSLLNLILSHTTMLYVILWKYFKSSEINKFALFGDLCSVVWVDSWILRLFSENTMLSDLDDHVIMAHTIEWPITFLKIMWWRCIWECKWVLNGLQNHYDIQFAAVW